MRYLDTVAERATPSPLPPRSTDWRWGRLGLSPTQAALAAGVVVFLSGGVASAQATGGGASESPATPHPRIPTGGKCTWLGETRCGHPRLTLAVDGGISHFSEGGPHAVGHGLGDVSETGAAWGARVGAEASPWLAFDIHYIGLYNLSHPTLTPTGTVGLLTNGLALEARLTIPLSPPWVQPYVLAGLGAYSTSIAGSSKARAGAQLHGTTNPGVPLGVGLSVPFAGRLALGAELVYHRYVNESFSSNRTVAGGDPVNVAMVLRASL